jgi:hypothetical protein
VRFQDRPLAFQCAATSPAAASGPALESLAITFPPVSFQLAEGLHRQGIAGSTAQGDYVAIPGRGAVADHYFFATHDNGAGIFVGVDPGDHDAALAGYTGHEVQLASGNRTAAQVATAIAAVASSVYASVVDSGSGVVTIEDEIDAAGAFTGGTYDAAGGGAITDLVPRIGGIRGHTHETQNASFTATTAASRLRASDLPADLFRVTGFRIRWGTAHTGQMQVAVYQGGSGFDFAGATLLGRLGVTVGSATSAWVDVLCDPDDVIEIDPANGPVWVAWMGDGATAPIAFFSATGVGVGAASHFEHNTADSNRAIWDLSGAPTGSAGTFPATMPARGTASAFKPAIQLLVQEAPYRGDWLWKSRIGKLTADALASTSAMTGVFTANSFTSPNVLGLSWDRIFVNYAAHDNAEQFRLECWQGGSATNNIATATISWDAGQTVGTAVGWVGIVDAGSHSLAAATRTWLSVKALSGSSSLAYGGGGIGYTAATAPAAFFGGAATESEYVSVDSGFSHDPSVATASPLTPSGSNINNSNAVGVYAIVKVAGFEMA